LHPARCTVEQRRCSCGEFTRGSLWRDWLWSSLRHDETSLGEAGRFVYANQNGDIVHIPFERLVERVLAMTPEEQEMPLGELAGKWGGAAQGVTPRRLLDAFACEKMLRGERTYFTI
jgi:hypothetical protein